MRDRIPWTLVQPDTRLVIEGSPRCGNTYAVAAFRVANGTLGVTNGTGGLAHHTHAPANVFRALRLGVPTLVLIREPEAAALSHAIYTPGHTVEDALRDYIAFYRTVLPRRDEVVVAGFEQLTSDFGEVIEAVNERFGTAFRRYDPTPQNEARARQILDRWARDEQGNVDENAVARPSDRRRARIEALRPKMQEPRARKLLADARDLYRRFTG